MFLFFVLFFGIFLLLRFKLVRGLTVPRGVCGGSVCFETSNKLRSNPEIMEATQLTSFLRAEMGDV